MRPTPGSVIDPANVQPQYRDRLYVSKSLGLKEWNGVRKEVRAEMAMRSGSNVADFLLSGFFQAGEAVLSTPGRIWIEGTNNFSSNNVGNLAYGNGVIVGITSTSQELERSTDGGKTFSADITNYFTGTVYDVAYGNGVFIGVGTNGEISRSLDDGATWSSLISNAFADNSDHIYSIIYDPETALWIAVGQGTTFVLRSDDNGATWATVTTPPDENLKSVADCGGGVLVAGSQEDSNVFRSTDSGDSWTAVEVASGETIMSGIAFGDGVLLTGTNPGGTFKLYRSVDMGLTWTNIPAWGSGDSLGSLTFAKNMFVAFESVSVDGGRTWASEGYSGGAAVFPAVQVAIVYDETADMFCMGAASGKTYYSKWLEAGAGVVEAGYTSDGFYMRWGFGIQLLVEQWTLTSEALTNAAGNIFASGSLTWTYGKPFTSGVFPPIPFMYCSDLNNTWVGSHSTVPTTTEASYRIDSATSQTGDVLVFGAALGWWI